MFAIIFKVAGLSPTAAKKIVDIWRQDPISGPVVELATVVHGLLKENQRLRTDNERIFDALRKLADPKQEAPKLDTLHASPRPEKPDYASVIQNPIVEKLSDIGESLRDTIRTISQASSSSGEAIHEAFNRAVQAFNSSDSSSNHTTKTFYDYALSISEDLTVDKLHVYDEDQVAEFPNTIVDDAIDGYIENMNLSQGLNKASIVKIVRDVYTMITKQRLSRKRVESALKDPELKNVVKELKDHLAKDFADGYKEFSPKFAHYIKTKPNIAELILLASLINAKKDSSKEDLEAALTKNFRAANELGVEIYYNYGSLALIEDNAFLDGFAQPVELGQIEMAKMVEEFNESDTKLKFFDFVDEVKQYSNAGMPSARQQYGDKTEYIVNRYMENLKAVSHDNFLDQYGAEKENDMPDKHSALDSMLIGALQAFSAMILESKMSDKSASDLLENFYYRADKPTLDRKQEVSRFINKFISADTGMKIALAPELKEHSGQIIALLLEEAIHNNGINRIKDFGEKRLLSFTKAAHTINVDSWRN